MTISRLALRQLQCAFILTLLFGQVAFSTAEAQPAAPVKYDSGTISGLRRETSARPP